jgi:2-(1,2-epoxy-1,2-dihydrophenyl)acetyl-CoA isomerase
MSFKTIVLERDGEIATLTLNRPDVMNSFNDEMIQECSEALALVETEAGIRALIVTGAGRGFSAGQDLGDVQERRDPGAKWSISEHLRKRYNPMITAMRELGKPVIAAVNGVAAGAGMSFALAADIRIASEHARFVQAFIGVGLVPDTGSSYFLPRLVGPSLAFELCATGRAVGAEEAARIGLVSRVVSPGVLMPAAKELARDLAARSPAAISRIKQMLGRTWNSDLAAMLDLEAGMQEEAAASPEHRRLVDEFLARKAKKE